MGKELKYLKISDEKLIEEMRNRLKTMKRLLEEIRDFLKTAAIE